MRGLFIWCLAAIALSGCGGGGGSGGSPDVAPPEPQPQPVPATYTITATVSEGWQAGAVDGAGEYDEGDTATLTATPADWYKFVRWEENQQEVSSSTSLRFMVTEDRELVAHFEEVPCSESDGSEVKIGYEFFQYNNATLNVWNRNKCDTIFIWATVSQTCYSDSGCLAITPINLYMKPGDAKGLPTENVVDGAKPTIIYRRGDGKSFEYIDFSDASGSLPKSLHWPVLILGYDDYHTGKIELQENQKIGEGWNTAYDCHNFSWIDMSKGEYQIAPDATQNDAFCQISIENRNSQDSIEFRYYVTDKSWGA